MVQLAKIIMSIFLIIWPSIAGAVAADGLESIQSKLERRYQYIEHLNGDALEEMDADEVILFDVREPREFAVSHLTGAIRVDPNIDAATFLAQHGDQLDGKTPVFYCSVGRRSSALLSRVADGLRDRGVEQSFNLEGGIFKWRNQERGLIRDGAVGPAETRSVHPYNRFWGRLVDDKSAIKFKPDKSSPAAPVSAPLSANEE